MIWEHGIRNVRLVGHTCGGTGCAWSAWWRVSEEAGERSRARTGFQQADGVAAADTKIHPRDIFVALPARSSRYEYLRDVQREVFDGRFDLVTKRDLVIKMNTGNGKTLVAFMLLKSALNEQAEQAGPAAYLTRIRCTWWTRSSRLPMTSG